MPVQTKLMLLFFVFLAAFFVYATLRVLCVWSEHHIYRHDLIVASKKQRNKYLKAIADRDAAIAERETGNVIIEEPEPALEPDLAQAA